VILPKIKAMLPASEVDEVRRKTKVLEKRTGLVEWTEKGQLKKSVYEATKLAQVQFRCLTSVEIFQMKSRFDWEWEMYDLGYKRSIVPQKPWALVSALPLKTSFEVAPDYIGTEIPGKKHLELVSTASRGRVRSLSPLEIAFGRGERSQWGWPKGREAGTRWVVETMDEEKVKKYTRRLATRRGDAVDEENQDKGLTSLQNNGNEEDAAFGLGMTL